MASDVSHLNVSLIISVRAYTHGGLAHRQRVSTTYRRVKARTLQLENSHFEKRPIEDFKVKIKILLFRLSLPFFIKGMPLVFTTCTFIELLKKTIKSTELNVNLI